MTETSSFEVIEQDEITILDICQRTQGLPLSEPDDMRHLWSIFHRMEVNKKKVLLIFFNQGVFAPERVDEVWEDIRSTKSSSDQKYAKMRAIRSNIKELIDFFQRSKILSIGAYSGKLDLDFFGLFALSSYRIFTTDSTIENRTINRLAPPMSVSVWYLTQMLGFAHASEIYLEEKSLTAQEARELKLVNAVVPPDELRSFAEQKANYFASKPWPALSTLMIALKSSHLINPEYLDEVGTGFENVLREK